MHGGDEHGGWGKEEAQAASKHVDGGMRTYIAYQFCVEKILVSMQAKLPPATAITEGCKSDEKLVLVTCIINPMQKGAQQGGHLDISTCCGPYVPSHRVCQAAILPWRSSGASVHATDHHPHRHSPIAVCCLGYRKDSFAEV